MENKHKIKTAALHTLGCRLNQAETAVIARNLKDKGFEIVPFGQAADLTVLNTCTVTGQAESKCRQAVRKSIRSNPDSYVAVVGCYAQTGVDVLRNIDGVDMIVGNEHKMQLADLLDTLSKQEQPRVVHTPKISRDSFIVESVGLYDNNTRANLKIQDGCNFVCSFCLIARARGPARSRVYQDILSEARQLAHMGHRELVLTGVNIGTYIHDGLDFLQLLKDLDKIAGIERIRISSIEPTTLTRELIDYMAVSEKVCPYLHIPLQSGDDAILESMRRKHSAMEFADIVGYAALKIPDIGIGTDVMVGYPTESDQAFENTKHLLADVPVSYFHVFSYSDRKGTTSYKLRPKVAPAVIKERRRIMGELAQRKRRMFYKEHIGHTENVLFEEKKEGNWSGLTGNYIRVTVNFDGDLDNQIRPVRLTAANNDFMEGEILE